MRRRPAGGCSASCPAAAAAPPPRRTTVDTASACCRPSARRCCPPLPLHAQAPDQGDLARHQVLRHRGHALVGVVAFLLQRRLVASPGHTRRHGYWQSPTRHPCPVQSKQELSVERAQCCRPARAVQGGGPICIFNAVIAAERRRALFTSGL